MGICLSLKRERVNRKCEIFQKLGKLIRMEIRWTVCWFSYYLFFISCVVPLRSCQRRKEEKITCTRFLITSISFLLCTRTYNAGCDDLQKTYSSHVVAIDAIATILLYFNSTLNPFLYCWKVKEMRQAVKQTIRRALCFPWTQIYIFRSRNLKEKKIEDRMKQTFSTFIVSMLQCLPFFADKYLIKTQQHCIVL